MAKDRQSKQTKSVPQTPPAPATEPPSRSHLHIGLLIGALALMFVPFLGKAFHMDDPLFVWAAKHIQTNPTNPYDFLVNWYGIDQSMSIVMENPPLASYYLALVFCLAGVSEVAAHVAFLVPALLSAFGMYLLSRRFCRDAVTAVAISVFTPVFFVSGLTVMSDVLMLTFWIFAVHFWLVGLDRESHAALAASSVLIALAAFSKYFGAALIPLLFTYSVMRDRGVSRWLVWMAVPLIGLAGFEITMQQLYGKGFLFGAAKYATNTTVGFGRLTPSKIAVSFAFLGGCLASVGFLAHRLWSRLQLGIATLLALGTAIVVTAMSELGTKPLPEALGARALFATQLGIWLSAGIGVGALAISDVRRERNAEAWLLAFWTLGTFVFAAFVNWTVNGRTLLPIVVPAGILVVRRLEQRGGATNPWRFPLFSPPLVAAAVLAVWVGWADARFANVARDGVTQITTEFSNVRRIWFEGHWGFQYYLMERGALPLYLRRTVVDGKSTSPWAMAPGDIIAIPGTNTNITPIPKEWYTFKKYVYLPLGGWLSTVNIATGGGFYSDELGGLPFAFGRVNPEEYILLDVRQPAQPGR